MASLAAQEGKFKINLTDLCPCDSKWMVERCCLDRTDMKLRKRTPSISPPGPSTSYSHPRCYLNGTNDCSEKISAEHYFSKNLLEFLAEDGGGITMSGMPFLKPGEQRRLAVDNLVANILCKRHNEALSPLDQEAGAFFRGLKDTLSGGKRRNPHIRLFDGTAIEAWMLKVACGVYFARLASAGGVRIADTHTINLDKVQKALFDHQWETAAGLYFVGSPGTVINTAFHLQFAPLTLESATRFCGARISFLGFECDLLFDMEGINMGKLVHRPHELNLRQKNRHSIIMLSWPRGTPMVSVNIEKI
ncbi:hypothetical protein G8O24_01265 [Bradyrhizobium sp. INPA01-394B]|uniref:Uncharacterized protein n=1 Tax=Bradyrhizobium campsiandrae TaxID=1729892 RepID=A0ABR7U0V7_9BRAD|nr:hypothetical protein [Bradyrhizobium campsiandrae]MBC9875974.1 hypothetical protein [Bradyrhizobium campsiandrae]MBC9976917.1 hypothetical protein [Bradyrhizobium campsiandrae]